MRIQGSDHQIFENKLQLKIKKFHKKLQYSFLRPPGRTSKLQKNFSPQKRISSTIETCNFWIFFYFCGSFLPSWIRIRILIPNPDPDPLTSLNPVPIRIRIRNTVWLQAFFNQSIRRGYTCPRQFSTFLSGKPILLYQFSAFSQLFENITFFNWGQ